MGRHHARVVAEHPETVLTAVVDSDPGADAIAYAWRARRFATTEELLREEPPDAAIVSVPTEDHLAVGLPLIEHGVPVLVEKPIASSVEDAVAIIDAAGANDVPLAIGHVERFNPAVRALQEKLHGDELGRIFQLHARRLSPFPDRIGETGVALDLATHEFDLMCELGGTPTRIAAEMDQRAHRKHEDLLAAILRFDSGIVGVAEVNWLTPDKVRQLTVTGERGMFVVDYVNQHLTLYENASAREGWETLAIFEGVSAGNVIRFAIPRIEPLRAQLNAFVGAVRGESPVAVTGEDGLRAVRLAFAAVDAAMSGTTILLQRAPTESTAGR
jgi:UDP-N-acetylglucosamine 3-dehydrogenase